MVGHNFRHRLLAYIYRSILHDFRKALVCDSIRPSGMDLYYTGLPDLFGGATCGVSIWNGGLTESTASIHYLHCVLD